MRTSSLKSALFCLEKIRRMFWGIIEEMSSLVDGKKPAKSHKKASTKVAVIIPNWNGAVEITKCLGSLQKQSLKPHIIVVDNGS